MNYLVIDVEEKCYIYKASQPEVAINWLKSEGYYVNDHCIETITKGEKLLNNQARLRVTLASNPKNPEVTIIKPTYLSTTLDIFDRQKSLAEDLKKKLPNDDEITCSYYGWCGQNFCEVRIEGGVFFDKVCGNGEMHLFDEVIKLNPSNDKFFDFPESINHRIEFFEKLNKINPSPTALASKEYLFIDYLDQKIAESKK